MQNQRLLILVFLLLVIPTGVQAQFNYTINTNLTITITGYTGSGASVTIPDTINGLPVTSIGNQAFLLATNLTDIRIPDSVGHVGDQAFAYCVFVTNVTMG